MTGRTELLLAHTRSVSQLRWPNPGQPMAHCAQCATAHRVSGSTAYASATSTRRRQAHPQVPPEVPDFRSGPAPSRTSAPSSHDVWRLLRVCRKACSDMHCQCVGDARDLGICWQTQRALLPAGRRRGRSDVFTGRTSDTPACLNPGRACRRWHAEQGRSTKRRDCALDVFIACRALSSDAAFRW
jgi:hypothetical protein